MVDYKKWDRIAAELSDEEDNKKRAKPRVTRLETPGKVTFGGGNITVAQTTTPQQNSQLEEQRQHTAHKPSTGSAPPQRGVVGGLDYSKWDKIAADLSDDNDDYYDDDDDDAVDNEIQNHKPTPPPQQTTPPQTTATTTPQQTQHNQPQKPSEAALSMRGAVLDGFRWSQTPLNVSVLVDVPLHTRAKDVAVEIVQADPFANPEVVVRVGGAVVLRRQLAFPIEQEKDGFVDWQLITHSLPTGTGLNTQDHRFVQLILNKKEISGAIFWWPCLFSGDPHMENNTQQVTTTQQQTKLAWDEAHKLFKQKIANHTQIEVDMGSDDADSESQQVGEN